MSMAVKAPVLSYARSKWLGVSLRMQNLSPARSVKVQRLFSTVTASSQTDAMKIFAQHTFYKGKSALSISPGKPVFKTNDAGAIILEREGSVFMEFAPSTGPRQYDWSRKQIFALSVIELGGLLGLTTSENCEFFHDPHMGSSNAGMVRKTLKVEGMPDKTGFFFNMSVVNKLENVEERFTVPVTKAEFAVMRSSFNFIIPYLMGWHAYTNPSLIQLGASNGKVNPELEWAK